MRCPNTVRALWVFIALPYGRHVSAGGFQILPNLVHKRSGEFRQRAISAELYVYRNNYSIRFHHHAFADSSQVMLWKDKNLLNDYHIAASTQWRPQIPDATCIWWRNVLFINASFNASFFLQYHQLCNSEASDSWYATYVALTM